DPGLDVWRATRLAAAPLRPAELLCRRAHICRVRARNFRMHADAGSISGTRPPGLAKLHLSRRKSTASRVLSSRSLPTLKNKCFLSVLVSQQLNQSVY